MRLKSVIAVTLAATLAAGTALANSCGCSSAMITLASLTQAERLAPEAAADPAAHKADLKLQKLLLRYDQAFFADYEAMSLEERKAHYALLDELRQERIADVTAVADAYEAAGADRLAVEILRGHAETLNTQTKDAVAVLQTMQDLLATKAAQGGDAYAMRAAAFVQEACNDLKQADLAKCAADAVANSDRYAPGHLRMFAQVAAPLLMLHKRVQQLGEGSRPITA